MQANMIEHGHATGRGNLLGVQVCVTAPDYASAETLRARLDSYLRAAAERGWLNERTVAVLPEYLGTWLAAAGEGERVLAAASLNGAMRALALRHPLRFVAALSRTGERDRIAAGLFRLQADRMAGAYQAVFARLARDHRVTLVAGSILLPAPEVVDGEVVAGRGPVQNVSAVFGPDGRAHAALVRKVFPIQSELPFVTGAALEALPAFDTPAGRLGVLICADSWHPPAYARLKAQRVDLVAVPSAILSAGMWVKAWAGYDGAAPPPDVDLADIGRLTEGQAWRKYALAGRLHECGAQVGINVFLRGTLWDSGTDGFSLGVVGGEVVETKAEEEALVNMWL